MAQASQLLDEETVVSYLRQRGTLTAEPTLVSTLSGGVSNIVLAVDTSRERVVLKQSLDRLRVIEDWHAPRERILREATGLDVAAQVTPGRVPRVVDVDETALTLTIERAPDSWGAWKDQLMTGSIAPATGDTLGRTLAAWHRATTGGAGLSSEFRADEALFAALRIDPYYRTVADRHLDLAPAIERVVDRMLRSRTTLVHGDFSPKNILVGDPRRLWVIDFEVVHFGDPVFDLAFLITHLLLKAIHTRTHAEQLRGVADSFLSAYTEGMTGTSAPVDESYLSEQVGCLLLARVAGKSPVAYLDEVGRQHAWTLGTLALLGPGADADSLWADYERTIA